jgi:hypothetical protein
MKIVPEQATKINEFTLLSSQTFPLNKIVEFKNVEMLKTLLEISICYISAFIYPVFEYR